MRNTELHPELLFSEDVLNFGPYAGEQCPDRSCPGGVCVRGFTLIELLVVVSIIGVLIGLTVPAVQMAREAARKASCLNNQKQLALAFMEYATVHGGLLPPSYSTTPVQRGWAIDLLPHLDAENFVKDWTEDAHYFEGNNQYLIKRHMGSFLCPSTPNKKRLIQAKFDLTGKSRSIEGSASDYFVHSGGVPVSEYGRTDVYGNPLEVNKRLSADAEDGVSQTIIVNEQAGRPDLWKEQKKESTQVAQAFRSLWAGAPVTQIPAFLRERDNIINYSNEGFYGFHTAGMHSAFMDGSARLISTRALTYIVLAMNTRDGEENVRVDDLQMDRYDESFIKDGVYPNGKTAL